MTMTYEKALDRVKKLLALAEGAGSEAEAANAAERAAALIAEYQLTEVELRLASGEDKSKEPIVSASLDHNFVGNRSAWESTIARAVANSYGCKMYWYGKAIQFFGRESSVQASIYTTQYLRAEVNRMCETAWAAVRDEELKFTERNPRVAARMWCAGFRLGAASEIARRIATAASERRDAAREAARRAAQEAGNVSAALAIVERDQREVNEAYELRRKNMSTAKPIGRISSRDGFSAGREAGSSVSLGGGRAGLGTGQGRLKGGE